MKKRRAYHAQAVHFDDSSTFLTNQGSGGHFDPTLGTLTDWIETHWAETNIWVFYRDGRLISEMG